MKCKSEWVRDWKKRKRENIGNNIIEWKVSDWM